MGMGSFKSQFWRQIKNDLKVHNAMEKLPSGSRNRVVWLLQAVSDPDIDGRRRRVVLKLANEMVPSGKKLSGLANRLRTIANELEQTAKMPGFVLGPDTLLKFAQQCRRSAGILARHSQAASLRQAPKL